MNKMSGKKLSDFCDITSSKRIYASEYKNEGVPFYRGKEIIEKQKGKLNVSTEKFISEEKYQKIKEKYDVPKAGELLLSSVGTLGVPYVIKSGERFYFKDGNLLWFKDFSNLDSRYLYYWFLSHKGKAQLKRSTIGSSQSAFTISLLNEIEIDPPNLETQQKIVSILSAFDDLIENNTRRIAILEQMARLIYREWFVYFRYPGHENDRLADSGTELGEVPEGWGVKKLEDVAEINPENISTDYEGKIEYINISGVDKGQINETEVYNFEDAPGRAKRKVKSGDIIWSSVRPNLKAYALIINPARNWIASTGFAVIRPVELPSSFLYNFTTTDYFVEYLVNHTRGSAYPAVNVSDFKDAKLVVPPRELVEKFNDLTWPKYQQIDLLKRKNKKLKATRDLLLPRLISGNIDIN